MAKAWRLDKYLRRLEAVMIVVDKVAPGVFAFDPNPVPNPNPNPNPSPSPNPNPNPNPSRRERLAPSEQHDA